MPPGIERRLVLRLLGHWRGLCGERKMPAFSEFNPTDIPDIWPHSFLLENTGTERGYIFRAVGDQMDSLPSGSLVGQPVTAAPADTLPSLALAYLDEMLDKGVPVSRGGEFSDSSGSRVLYRSVLLPIGDEANAIQGILGAANCRKLVDN